MSEHFWCKRLLQLEQPQIIRVLALHTYLEKAKFANIEKTLLDTGLTVQPWRTLVEVNKERYRPPGKLTLELVHANQNKINFYVYGLCSLPSGPVRFLTSFY